MEGSVKVQTTEDDIRIEARLAVSPQHAWSLITQKEHIAHWWGNHVILEAKPKGKLEERWSDGGRQIVTSGEVIRCQPPSVLEMTWADDDWPGDTRVAFHLSGHDDATRLVLEHSGWRVHRGAIRRSLIDAHAAGWSQYVKALEDYASALGSRRGTQ